MFLTDKSSNSTFNFILHIKRFRLHIETIAKLSVFQGKSFVMTFFFYFCRIFMLKVFFERILYKNWLLKDRERKRGNQEWENLK